MSMIVSKWSEARNKINNAIDIINSECNFNLPKDIFLRSCLYLTGSPLNFKADNFKSRVIERIELQFEDIFKYLKAACRIFNQFGYSKDNLRSNLIILPVAQFLLQNNTTELDIHNMKLIENWVQRSILLHKCRGRGFSVFCKFFKYPSPEAYASPSPSWGEGSGLHRPGCDKILGTDCASRPRMTGGRGANYFGRSMIEMLGVLAIIGVLSVGGIAGYSKAMENMYFSNTENKVGNRFVFDIWFARSASSNNSLAYNLCRAFYQDVGVAMSSTVLAMIVQGGKHYVYGETVCHDGTDDKDNSRHCLRDLTLPEISDICKTCQSTNCAVYLVF